MLENEANLYLRYDTDFNIIQTVVTSPVIKESEAIKILEIYKKADYSLANIDQSRNLNDKLHLTHLAVVSERFQVMRWLFQNLHETYVNRTTKQGTTALMFASYMGLADYVKALLKYKLIELDLVDVVGRTSFWYASERGHVDIVKLHIRAKADVNIPDHFGKTPLAIARENKHSETARLIEEAGGQMEVSVKTSKPSETPPEIELLKKLESKEVSDIEFSRFPRRFIIVEEVFLQAVI